MLSSVHLKGFKGFRDTNIGSLRKVNLVVGGQNLGKTSFLEAVYIPLNRGMSSTPFRSQEGNDLNRFIGHTFDKHFEEVALRFSDGREIGFKNQNFYGLTFFPELQEQTTPVVIPIPLFLPQQEQLVRLFGQLVLALKKRDLIEMLQQIEPRLESLDAVSPDGEQRIYAELTGIDQALPLPVLGHGFAHLLYLFSTLLSTDAKLALIDEVENGIHYSALDTLLQGIKNVAYDRDVQTIMTTHSMDCIKAASKVFEDSPDDFQVIRLVRTADNIEADIIPADYVQAVLDYDGELR